MQDTGRHTVWLILASASFTMMAGAIIGPVLNLIREGFHATPATVGLIITTHGLFVAIASPFIGSLIDRIGTKRPLMGGLVLYSIAGGAGLLLESFWMLIVSRAFLGVAIAAMTNSIMVIILNLYKGRERDKVMGWRASTNSYGGVIWPFIGGVLGHIFWRLPFAVYLFGLPLAVLTGYLIPETHREKENAGQGSVIKLLFEKPALFVIFGMVFLYMTYVYSTIIFMPQFLELLNVTDPFHISLFMIMVAFSSGTTSLFYARIKSLIPYRKILPLALFVYAVAYSGLSQVPSKFFVLIPIVFIGMAQGMLMPSLMIWLGDVTPPQFRGRITSYFSGIGYIGQFASPIIFGAILLIGGLRGVFMGAGIISATLFLIFIVALIAGSKRKE